MVPAIQDVACRAGVSQSTVDYALPGKRGISESLRINAPPLADPAIEPCGFPDSARSSMTIATARSRSSAGCCCRDAMSPNFPRSHSLQGTRGSSAELVPGDDAARALAAAAYDAFIGIVAAAMARAQATGEVTASAAPEAQARLLPLPFQGAALVSRAQPDRDGLVAIDAALDALRPST